MYGQFHEFLENVFIEKILSRLDVFLFFWKQNPIFPVLGFQCGILQGKKFKNFPCAFPPNFFFASKNHVRGLLRTGFGVVSRCLVVLRLFKSNFLKMSFTRDFVLLPMSLAPPLAPPRQSNQWYNVEGHDKLLRIHMIGWIAK